MALLQNEKMDVAKASASDPMKASVNHYRNENLHKMFNFDEPLRFVEFVYTVIVYRVNYVPF